MRPELSHDEAFAELDAVAFDIVDAAERDAIMLHVATCAVCSAELHALRDTAAHVAFSAAPPPANIAASRSRIRDRLVARAVAERETPQSRTTPLVFPVPTTAPHKAVAPRHRRSSWLAIAAGIVCVASLGMLGLVLRGRKDLVDALKVQANLAQTARLAVDSLHGQLASRDSLIAGIVGRDVTVMVLTSKSAKEPYARMFWDRSRHTWTMVAHNMPDAKKGRTYQLWLVTPKSKISAGTFTPDNGEAVVIASHDLTEPLSAVAVTDEPAGGVAQPTSPPIIAAQQARPATTRTAVTRRGRR
jgi:hypothetical protein